MKVKNDSPVAVWKSSDQPRGGTYGARTCSPVLDKDYFYVVCDNETLCCLDVKTGKPMWKQGGFGAGSWAAGLIKADGVLFVMNYKDSAVVMVQPTPTGYVELGRLPSQRKDKVVVAPALADKKLYIRTYLYLTCVDLSPDIPPTRPSN